MGNKEDIKCSALPDQHAMACVLQNDGETAKITIQQDPNSGKTVIMDVQGNPGAVQSLRKRMEQLGIRL